MGDPGDYIGSKISLISRSEIRYEGILHSINNVDSSLTLQNVKSYGTEGRKQIGPQIPPSAEIYDYIMFKGTDIKDIQIDQSGAPAQRPPQQQAPAPAPAPAPQRQAPPPQNYQQLQYQQPPRQQFQQPAPAPAPAAPPANPWNRAPVAQPAPVMQQQQQQQQQRRQAPAAPKPAPAPPKAKPSSFAAAIGGGGGGVQPKGQVARVAGAVGGGRAPPAPRAGQAGGRGGPRVPAPRGGPAPAMGDGYLPTRMAVPQEDFDFNAAFSKFNKEELFNKAEMKKALPDVNAGPTYVKDDFFDTMSCEALEKQQEMQQQGGRARFAQMRRHDMETFGAAGGARRTDHGLNQGGRGGRGGPGGRGAGRGDFRGGRGDSRGQGGRGGRGGRR